MHNAASTTKLGHQQMGVRNREQVKRGGGEWKKKGVTKVVAGGGGKGAGGVGRVNAFAITGPTVADEHTHTQKRRNCSRDPVEG